MLHYFSKSRIMARISIKIIFQSLLSTTPGCDNFKLIHWPCQFIFIFFFVSTFPNMHRCLQAILEISQMKGGFLPILRFGKF